MHKRWMLWLIILQAMFTRFACGFENLGAFVPDGLRKIINEPMFEVDVLPYINQIEASEALKTSWGNQVIFGWMAFRRNNLIQSEQQWQKALETLLPQDMNKALIKKLCKIYNLLHSPLLFLLYEKYTEAFPKEQDVPRVHLALGYYYQTCQAFERSLLHYYKVLNGVLGVDTVRLQEYESYVIWAQLGIAQVYLDQKKYEEAFEFFSKIHFKNTDAKILANILYKRALCAYCSDHMDEAIKLLEKYCDLSVDTAEKPEAYYYLIHAYKRRNEKQKVLEAIFALLKLGQEKRVEQAEHWQIWDKYQKLSAGEIAQDFYREGNLIEAVKLYQALVDMNKSPDWQWPILCQIGLCYERLGLSIKSKAAYELITAAVESWNDGPIQWTEDLRNYQLQAKWHLEQIIFYEKTKLNFEQLLQSM